MNFEKIPPQNPHLAADRNFQKVARNYQLKAHRVEDAVPDNNTGVQGETVIVNLFSGPKMYAKIGTKWTQL